MSEGRFDSVVYGSRLARAADLAGQAGLDALFVTTGPDFRYLTGSRAETFERLTVLVIPAQGRPRVVVPKMELAALRSSALGDLGVDMIDWVDGDDPYALALDGLGTINRFAVVDAMPALHSVPFTHRIGVPPELATVVLREMRMVKDADEIEALRRAGAAIDRVHARVGDWLKAGRTEREVAADIDAAIVAEGHTVADFIIVGSGPNGADPHHEVSDRVIDEGDVVVVDIGGPVEPGYNSDSTRTYVVGSAPSEVTDVYAVLQRAQQAAVDAIRPGATAGEIDAAARSVITEAGYGDYFIHRTGHGIGLSVHEEPYIVGGSDQVLREGMAFSVEPGIYFPGSWGARIEDIVVVTADGGEPMNTQPHELRSV
ncbi:Xaa-Pro peptidase family protein [Gordonia jinhuaensis]|uniref:Dipeptidase n=1 Tax=Gordonia jinhuaensis TaxID=1517702 RepID=A0A916T177_9ACTN|nr:Xaa-Pro peptidase family protein [Gordonia jinhuaensis]GGB24157.1 dipeptidase [Gordonia jinhuaensis]